ncbi:hypothetical protein J4481_01135 [Candidatus Pacearchaeota archaeon]|nr:hypothetical protein [Candidatus Pacearchaeota archaeon]
MKDEKFEILKTPNFYFPLLHKGQKFEIIGTYNLRLDVDENKHKEILNLNRDKIAFKIYADLIWEAVKKEKLNTKYKDCWIVPISLSKFKDYIKLEVDVLRPIKK